MVLMGILNATVVCVFILPVSARTQLRKDAETNTDLLGEFWISTTRAFLSGREDDLQDKYFNDLWKEERQSLQEMTKDLDEVRKKLLAP